MFTPNQVAQILEIDENKIYRELSSWSIYHLRKVFIELGIKEATRVVRPILTKSPATLSRHRIVLSVDDTVIDRPGKSLPLCYSWFSGRAKQVVKGQNILAITLRVNERVIPIAIRPVSKQGRGNTSKPKLFISMLEEVIRKFKQEGIELRGFPITFDSWYGSMGLAEILQNMGFRQILSHAKSNYVFNIDGTKTKLTEHKKQIKLEEDCWGCQGKKVARRKGTSPTFGEVVLLFFKDLCQIKCLITFGKKLRACEMISIWRQHHGIEEFWRNLKYDLQLKRMRPTTGAYYPSDQ